MTPTVPSGGRSLAVAGAVAALGSSPAVRSSSSGTAATSLQLELPPRPLRQVAADVADGSLKIGTVLPQTGSLAFLGPPEFAGVDLALKDDQRRRRCPGTSRSTTGRGSDSGDTSTDIASKTVDRRLWPRVSTPSSAPRRPRSRSPSSTRSPRAGALQISPANTSIKTVDRLPRPRACTSAPPRRTRSAGRGCSVELDPGRRDNHKTAADASPSRTRTAPVSRRTFRAGLRRAAGGTLTSDADHLRPQGGDVLRGRGHQGQGPASPEALVAHRRSTRPRRSCRSSSSRASARTSCPSTSVDGNLANSLADGLPEGHRSKGTKGTTPGAKASDDLQEASLLSINSKPARTSPTPPSPTTRSTSTALAAEEAKSDWPAPTSQLAHAVDVSAGRRPSARTFKPTATGAAQDQGKDIDYDGHLRSLSSSRTRTVTRPRPPWASTSSAPTTSTRRSCPSSRATSRRPPADRMTIG